MQRFDRRHPTGAPEWAYVVQDDDMVFDTEDEQAKSGVEDHVTEEEEEVEAGCSAAKPNKGKKNYSDSDHLEMDD